MRTFVRSLAIAIVVLLSLCAAPASADQDTDSETLAGGAWHAGKLVPCANGFVTSVHSRLVEAPSGGAQTFGSGVVVEMKLPTAPTFLNGQPFRTASVVHYDSERGNALMQAEKPGNRVQVCFIGFPTTSHDPHSGRVICDPNVDPRGMTYRVYDYKNRTTFMGPDSEHGCGGA